MFLQPKETCSFKQLSVLLLSKDRLSGSVEDSALLHRRDCPLVVCWSPEAVFKQEGHCHIRTARAGPSVLCPLLSPGRESMRSSPLVPQAPRMPSATVRESGAGSLSSTCTGHMPAACLWQPLSLSVHQLPVHKARMTQCPLHVCVGCGAFV